MSESSTAPLVRTLCEALEADGVRYCHWKSNAFLDRSRRAENDLDLLVSRADGGAFAATLHRLGFKAAERPGRAIPGIVDYYGYDAGADALVHVHAHYELVVGDDLTKNYRIPLERAFLENTTRDGEFRIPVRELELILLVIRLTLKHSTWDAALTGQTTIPSTARAELAFLRARADEDSLSRMLMRHLPLVDPRSFAACLRSLDPGVGTWTRLRAARPLVAELQGCTRRTRAADVGLKVSRRAVGILHRVSGVAPARKRLASGGAVIAVVGADGAGKSTIVEGLRLWLSRDFAVTTVHLGRPPRSFTTRVVAGGTKLKLAVAVMRSGRASRAPDTAAPLGSTRYPALAVATARDRFRAYEAARRLAGEGALVICDRFPLSQVGLMDAPRIERSFAGTQPSRVNRWLSTLEQRYYRAVAPPDVLIVLRVDPEIAVKRKPDESPEFVRARWSELWSVDWDVPAHVVDATASPSEVLSEVKSLVWAEL